MECHDCGVKIGKLHKQGCDVARCTICGAQLLMCKHYPEGNSVWSGIMSLEYYILCEALDLPFVKWVEGKGWVETTRDDPDGSYDANKGSVVYQKALREVRKRESHD